MRLGKPQLISLLVVIAGAVALAFVVNEYWLRVLQLVFVYALLAVSLQLLFGYAGQVSLGHAAFAAVGAYTAAWMAKHTDVSIGIVCGVIAAVIVGALIAPVSRLSGGYLAVTTLALNYVLVVVLTEAPGLGGSLGMLAVPRLGISGLEIDDDRVVYLVLLTVLLVAVFLVRRLVRFRFGRAMGALRLNEVAAVSVGVSPMRYKAIAFAISAGLAGLAGALFVHVTSYVNPETFNPESSILLVAMIVVGGLGSFAGAVIGAVVVTTLPELLRSLEEPRVLVFSGAVVAFLVLAPRGIVGLLANARRALGSRMPRAERT